VRHDVSGRDVLFAFCCKFWPVARNRGIDVEFSPVSQHQADEEGHGLGRRPDIDQGVFGPWNKTRLVAGSTPQVKGDFAFVDNAQRGADVLAGVELRLEDVSDGLEPVAAESVKLY
jgi:hypothetical protein